LHQYIVLKIEMPSWNTTEVIHPVVLADDNHRVLIDCGYAGSLPKIEEALIQHGIMPQNVTHVILTHQDHDHMGAAAAFKRKYPQAQIMTSVIEAPYISGEEKSLRLIQAEQLQQSLPPEQQAFGEAFCNMLRNIEPVRIDRALTLDEELPFCGSCRVIATPGHTPGHISLYLPALNVVITGDAMALEKGKPVIANPQFTLDLDLAKASMERLFSIGAETIVCYHGGVIRKEDVIL
jgi:glyoxylase-like metal-dependent hydrolase (beta-lactamase superfamily II)